MTSLTFRIESKGSAADRLNSFRSVVRCFAKPLFETRAYLDIAEASLFRRTAGCCRLVYNLCLEQRRLEWYRSAPRRLTAAGQMKELKDLKAAAPFLRQVPHHPLQQAIRYLDPLQIKVDRDGQRVFLPKAGWVRLRIHREIIGDVKNVTVSQAGAWWFVSIAVEQTIDEPALKAGPTVGIDLGVVNAIATSDGAVFDLPRVGAQEQRQLAAVHVLKAGKTLSAAKQ